MAKRRRGGDDALERPGAKRSRTGFRRNLLEISDEILLRILSHLPTEDLLRTECVSRRMRALATDGEIWRTKYFETFTRPRLRRTTVAGKPDGSIDFKSRFKMKTNWVTGKAHFHEVDIRAPPPVIAKVHDGMVFTCDPVGLRAWSSKPGTRALKAQIQLMNNGLQATCITTETIDENINILLGFTDGSFSVYSYRLDGRWEHRSTQPTADGPLIAVSLAYPYAMTVSKSKHLSIYQLDTVDTQSRVRTIAQLQSEAWFSPISVSLRRAPTGIIAAVAYAFKRLHSGWCLGLQEIRLSSAGRLLDSRLVSTVETPTDLEGIRQSYWDMQTRSTSSTPLPLHPQLTSPPTSLSYEHPYLIGTLADNTLMTFLVTSNDEKLEISCGRRLWGHTSAIAQAEVNNRGKAVSISSRGDETRVWELEAVMTGGQTRTSTQVRAVDALSSVGAALARRGPGLGLALREVKHEHSIQLSRRWVGFDEQRVAVLAETADQKQVLALYDFT